MLKPIKRLLQNSLKNELSKKELSLLPSSYQKIGDIIIVNLKKELWKHDKKICQLLLEKIPNTRTVCRRTGFIEDQFRKPQIKVAVGDKNTETIHKEHGILYKLDVDKIMFAKGNLTERKRISKLLKRGETVIDMFAGIGYFSLSIAKSGKPKKVYSIEINPKSFQYLNENIKLNKINKIVSINGDSKIEAKKLGRIADRVIMGLLPSSKSYLSAAMKVIRPNGTIHYHTTSKKESFDKHFEDVKKTAKKEGLKVKLIKKVKVKSYAPKIYHLVLDCKILR